MTNDLISKLDFPDGRTFTVVINDILHENVDGIVNSATNNLSYGLGVASTIVEAAGSKLKNELNKIIRERKSIHSGEIVLTRAGDLPFKGIIHVVSPSQGEASGYTLLKKALMSSFVTAQENGWRSLTFPAVGSGIHAIAFDRCAAAYVSAVYDYFKDHPSSPLKTIRLCILSREQVNLVDAVVKSVEHAKLKISEWVLIEPAVVQTMHFEGRYQVFLCFKNTDDEANPTCDSVLAQKVYDYLVKKGLTVFFSARTLEELGIAAYKRAIDDALDSAQVLVTVGTSQKNLDSEWVRYEWDSYYSDILSGLKPKGKIFTYVDGIPLSKLPRALRQTQCIKDGPDSLEHLYRFIANALGVQTTFVKNNNESFADYKRKNGREGGYQQIGDLLVSATKLENISWLQAHRYAVTMNIGDYKGWRLPSIEELKVIRVSAIAGNNRYLSCDTSANDEILYLHFEDGHVVSAPKSYSEGMHAVFVFDLQETSSSTDGSKKIDSYIMSKLLSDKTDSAILAFSKVDKEDKYIYLSALVEMLESKSPRDIIAAMQCLFSLRYKDLPTQLVQLAKDESSAVRRRAIYYLGSLRHKNAFSLVNEACSDKSPDVRAAAREAYKMITGKPITRSDGQQKS